MWSDLQDQTLHTNNCERLWKKNEFYYTRGIIEVGVVYGQQRHFIDFRFLLYSSSSIYPLKTAQVWGSNSILFHSYGVGIRQVLLLVLSLRGIRINRDAEII